MHGDFDVVVPYPGTPYPVIVGSGGSPFGDKLVTRGTGCSTTHPCEPTLTNPYHRYYAWALVSVHASGTVSLQVSGFGDNYQGATEILAPGMADASLVLDTGARTVSGRSATRSRSTSIRTPASQVDRITASTQAPALI